MICSLMSKKLENVPKREYDQYNEIPKKEEDLVRGVEEEIQGLSAKSSETISMEQSIKPNVRPRFQEMLNRMKALEILKAFKINSLKMMRKNKREAINLLTFKVDTQNSGVIDNEEIIKQMKSMKRAKSNYCETCLKAMYFRVELICGHEICKDYLIPYIMKLFTYKTPYMYNKLENPYEYRYLCSRCKGLMRPKKLTLYCGCAWSDFGKNLRLVTSGNSIHYGSRTKNHPLKAMDFCLINDYIVFETFSVIVSEYNDPVVSDRYSRFIELSSIANIVWVLRFTSAIKHLKLNCLKYEEVKTLNKELEINRSVSKLTLRQNYFKYNSLVAISEMLKINNTIKHLDLLGNAIEVNAIEIISNMLKSNKTLKVLNLECNYLKPEAAEYTSEALKVNSTLEELNLNNNVIKNPDAIVISKAIAVNKTLKCLDLECNHINYAGVKFICEALKINKTLKELSLAANRLGNEGATSIAEMLKKNRALEKPNLECTLIEDTGIRTIDEALSTNLILVKLDLEWNMFGMNTKVHLKK
eukprot:TRINITY_DN2616_c0_g1_i3.p1 TRINITY_DN2616_c0_g1~~TRINITY_DN2616_c0_g1_i3.p1  ORF type:complete len:529 (-),score=68.88 TRINITY_DN2616_c0_g1_i3:109-1695(-)